MEAVDILHIVERLTSLSQGDPGAHPEHAREVAALLHQAGLGNGAAGYTAEKLGVVRECFARWFGAGVAGQDLIEQRRELQHDIEHLKKALARHSSVQD